MTGPVRAPVERFFEAPDGAQLFVTHAGPSDGTPLVLLDGLGCAGFAFSKLKRAMQPHRPWFTFHYRGHGRSDMPTSLDVMTIQQCIDDLWMLLDAYGHTEVILVGHSMGVQVALEASRQAPERVRGMVLMCGSYEHPIESWHGAPEKNGGIRLSNSIFKRAFNPLSARAIRHREVLQPLWSRVLRLPIAYEIGSRTEVNGKKLTPRDFGQYLSDLADIDISVFFGFARDLAQHSAAPYLHTLKQPSLVIVGTHDTYTPMWRGRELAARLPESELVVLDGGTHTAPLEHPVTTHRSFDTFLERHGL